jgi:putative aldouronate transport system permease protein
MSFIQEARGRVPSEQLAKLQASFAKLGRYWPLYLMLVPGILYYLVFRYWPIYGLVIAFKNFRVLDGIVASPWVGFDNFEALFNSPLFMRAFRNTLVISTLKLVVGFPMPIILALMLNEVRHGGVKRVIQTISYLPHFLSWVIIYAILIALLSPARGLVSQMFIGADGAPIPFLTDPGWFLGVVISSDVWKEIGWGAIIYLAALTAISPELYEAAAIDGANRLQQIWHISIPGIMPVILLMFILRLGYVLDAGFDQIYILYNPLVYESVDIIDTWVFRNGIEEFRFGLSTAASVFKSVFGLVLLLVANRTAKRVAGQGIW